MAKIDVLDILRAKKKSPLEFNYDNLWIPPMGVFLTPDDVEALRRIATSLKLSSKIQEKYRMIDDIMRRRGFKRFAAGTNRVVYSFLEDTRFVVKIAVDRVGMQDNPMEYRNQELIKPYCAKMFYISPCGTVGFAERVLPVKSKAEFKNIASDVFDILTHKILGKYVMEDIGVKYFMNYGVRYGYGPVLLDYPFIYKLDGNKLFCNKVDPSTNEPCNGEIDYDVGFNHLVCTRCGKIYLATDLKDDSIENKIIIKGGNQMKVVLKVGDEIVGRPIPTEEVMTPPRRKIENKLGLVVKISGGNIAPAEEVVDKQPETPTTPVIKEDKKEEKATKGEKKPEVTPEKREAIENIEKSTESKFIPKDAATDQDDEEDEEVVATATKPESVYTPDPVVVETEDEDANTEVVEPAATTASTVETSIADKYADMYDDYDDDGSSFRGRQPIRKKNTVERDANGRFVSTKNGSNKKKNNRIPSNK